MPDFSIALPRLIESIYVVRDAWTAPHVLLKPSIYPDGTKWCALLGPNIQEGIVGFGGTPAEAAADFDRAWCRAKTPDVMRIEAAIEEEDRREEELNNGQFGVGA